MLSWVVGKAHVRKFIMEKKLISIIDAAKALGVYKQTLFKIVKRLNIETTRQKNSAHRGQAISYIKDEDMKLISEHLSSNTSNSNGFDASDLSDQNQGVFYLIQLEPEHDPGRYKLGFASNIDERLRSHRCSAPFSTVLKTWPCKALWEKTAIDCVTQESQKIHTEVFRTDSIEEVKNKCDYFFALMPEIGNIA